MATGARTVGSYYGISDVMKEFDSSDTLAANDVVNLNAGEIRVVPAGSSILGVVAETATASSTNVQVNVTPGSVVIMDNDNDSTTDFASTDVGQYFDLIGGTGAQQIDTSSRSTTTGQVMTLEYNPQGKGFDDDTSIGLFVFNETNIPQ